MAATSAARVVGFSPYFSLVAISGNDAQAPAALGNSAFVGVRLVVPNGKAAQSPSTCLLKCSRVARAVSEDDATAAPPLSSSKPPSKPTSRSKQVAQALAVAGPTAAAPQCHSTTSGRREGVRSGRRNAVHGHVPLRRRDGKGPMDGGSGEGEKAAVAVRADGSVEEYLRCYNRWLRQGGRLQDCVQLLEGMDKHGLLDMDKVYHTRFFDECKRAGDVASAFRFFALVRRNASAQPQPPLRSYNQMLAVCSHCADVSGAVKVFQKAMKDGVQPDTQLYTTLISACCRAGNVDLAFKFFYEMEAAGIQPNSHTMSALIDGCAKSRQLAKAFGVYGLMLSKKLRPDAAVFNALITACARTGSLDRAFDTLSDMQQQQKVPANHITMGALMTACAHSGQTERALDVYREMRARGNVRPSLPVFTAAVHACSATGDWEQASAILQDMQRDGVQPDEILFSALIDVARHAGKADAAEAAVDEMWRAGITPGTATTSALMTTYCQLGLATKAIALYAAMRTKVALSLPTYNALVALLCTEGRLEEALAVVDDMRAADVAPDRSTYATLLEACKARAAGELALKLYSCARADGVRIGLAICTLMIDICADMARSGLPTPSNAADLVGPSPVRTSPDSLAAYSPLGGSAGVARTLQPQQPPLQLPGNWPGCAVAIYRQSVACGVVPTMQLLAKLFALLRNTTSSSSSSSGSSVSSSTTTTCSSSSSSSSSGGGVDSMSPVDDEEDVASSGTGHGGGSSSIAIGMDSQEQEGWGVNGYGGREEVEVQKGEEHMDVLADVRAGIGGDSATNSSRDRNAFGAHSTSAAEQSFGRIPSPPGQPMPPLGMGMGIGMGMGMGMGSGFSSLGSPGRSSPATDVGAQVATSGPFSAFHPLAYSLYEEAEKMGAVPTVSSAAGPVALKFANTFPPTLAEVCVLVLLQGLMKRQLAAPGLTLFPVSISVPVDTMPLTLSKTKLQPPTPPAPTRGRRQHLSQTVPKRNPADPLHLRSASPTGQGVAALLRRLELPYSGYETQGVVRLTSNALFKWLRQFTLAMSLPSSSPAAQGYGSLSPSSFGMPSSLSHSSHPLPQLSPYDGYEDDKGQYNFEEDEYNDEEYNYVDSTQRGKTSLPHRGVWKTSLSPSPSTSRSPSSAAAESLSKVPPPPRALQHPRWLDSSQPASAASHVSKGTSSNAGAASSSLSGRSLEQQVRSIRMNSPIAPSPPSHPSSASSASSASSPSSPASPAIAPLTAEDDCAASSST